MKGQGEGEIEIGQDCAADEEWSRSRETGTGREVKGWKKCGDFGAERMVWGRQSAKCCRKCCILDKKRGERAAFLIFDDWQTFMAYVVHNMQKLNKQICSSATTMTFFPLWTKYKRIPSPYYVVIPNLMGVCVSIPMAKTIKHICLE